MAPTKNDREARARLRGYQARQTLHSAQIKRRLRDNVAAVIGVVAVVIIAAVTQVLYFTTGPGTPEATPTSSSSATAAPTDAAGQNTGDVPSSDIAEDRTWTGSMTINGDDLGISLDGAAAPQAVSSFISLAQSGFYDGLSCHRLTTSGLFVLQCGDPSGDGTGGPGFSYGPVENAPADDVYPAGTIAMARQGDNGYSQGSQFFIVYEDTTLPTDSAGGYTVLGTVTSGLDALKTDVVDAGVSADSSNPSDGAPAVATTIGTVTVQ